MTSEYKEDLGYGSRNHLVQPLPSDLGTRGYKKIECFVNPLEKLVVRMSEGSRHWEPTLSEAIEFVTLAQTHYPDLPIILKLQKYVLERIDGSEDQNLKQLCKLFLLGKNNEE